VSLGDLICIIVERLEGFRVHGSLEWMSSEEIWVDPPDDGPDELLGVGHCLLAGGLGEGFSFCCCKRLSRLMSAVDTDAFMFL